MADRGDILTVNNDGLGWGSGGRGAATHAGFATANASLHAVDTPLYAANVGLHTVGATLHGDDVKFPR